jgi:aspartyl-tRNA(Asn)/glutamyl-tRNA(Gln) amidotransferase subunit C
MGGFFCTREANLGYNTNDMKLPPEIIEGIANLAQLELTEQEKDKYAEDLSATLSYVDELQKVDTQNVVETMQITGLTNSWAEDVVQPSDISREEFLKRAPDSDKGMIKVKKVL